MRDVRALFWLAASATAVVGSACGGAGSGADGGAGGASGNTGNGDAAGLNDATVIGRSDANAGGAGAGGSSIAAGGTGGSAAGGAGGAAGAGGAGGGAGASGGGGAGGVGGDAGSGGDGGSGVPTPDGGYGSSGDGGACSSALSSRVRITEVDVGIKYDYNEVDNNGAALGLTPLAISPIPGGGSRLAFLGNGDGMVHVATLDANDQLVAGSTFGLPGYDFQDIYADTSGGTLLISRAALGSTLNNNCGNIDNLCGLTTNYPTAASCYDMYMVRFDGATETWATKLTQTTAMTAKTAALPAYGTSATAGGNVIFIWSEYAHNGRIAFDGTNYAGYFGAAITVPNQACVGSSTLTTGVNIHQGDRMQVVNGSGVLQTSEGFSFGCSHSGYERLIWDPTADKFIPVCKNDAPAGTKSGRIAFAPNATTIDPVDLYYSDLGNVLLSGGGGYWVVTSDIRAGQTPNSNGLADIHLLAVPSLTTATPSHDLLLVSDTENDRAPHIAAYGKTQVLAAWEESTAKGDLDQNDPARQMYIQILDGTAGGPPAGSSITSAGPLKLSPNVLGSRYQDFRAYPDGSVAYPAPGSSATSIKILRVLGCNG
jgi:hypothetical protein